MSNETIKKRSLSRTAWISLLCAALLLVAGIGSVFAYVIIDGSNDPEKQIVETFVPGKVSVEVTETSTDEDIKNGKHTFTITNKENVAAYIRLAVVCNWINDTDGTLHWETPMMNFKDSMHGDLNAEGVKCDTEWRYATDGYHYFEMPVAAGATVNTVFTVLDPTKNIFENGTSDMADVAPEGYSFRVTVIAEGIQAVGETVDENSVAIPAIKDAWKTDVIKNIDTNNGKLTITEKNNS